MKKFDPNEKVDKERDDALEYYMRRVSELEDEVSKLKERLARLIWSMEEHD